jgi:hydrogenase nickel incorporation protein HypA/HybF
VHELSVCHALLTQVSNHARARGAESVECITIEVGPLSGTEPGLLREAFLIMRSGGAATAKLIIERGPVRILCLQCGVNSETRPSRLLCASCGGWRTRLIAGDELRLLRVEMRMPKTSERQDSPRQAERADHV